MRRIVFYICKIDKQLYRVVTPDIRTDEVVITEEQIAHIRSNHPNDYERFSQYLVQILTQPDYILEANLPNTAMVLKEIVKANTRFKLILRLQTSTDPAGFKNSVITFQRVEAKRYRRYLRNARILYARKQL